MRNKFKVGDKVKNEKYGKGYIAEIDDIMYLVVHDKESRSLHDGNNDKGYPKNRCWWYFEGAIEKIDCTKNDLQTGDVVTLRNGDKLMLDKDGFLRDLQEEHSNPVRYLAEFENDLTRCGSTYDIIKVERPTYTTVFERDEEVKEMTLKEICDALGYEVKVIKEGE